MNLSGKENKKVADIEEKIEYVQNCDSKREHKMCVEW